MTYLILRFSSLGNVAMSVPVIESVARLQPQDTFVVLAKKRLEPLFEGMSNVHFYELDAHIKPLTAFANVKRLYGIEQLIDLQDNWATRIIRLVARMHKIHSHVIEYGRKDKRLLCMRGYKHSQPLPTEFDRYEMTFHKAGLKTDKAFSCLPVNTDACKTLVGLYGEKNKPWIGVAPFAKSRTNMLPYKRMKEVISNLSQHARVYLFGAGEIECEMLRQWASVLPDVVSVAGMLPLEQELELMRQLDVMLCMDSANQHLASLVGLRVVSLWCGTHPYMGFYAWKQNPDDCLQKPLSCRPCTIHGTKLCQYGNYLCQQFDKDEILDVLLKPKTDNNHII